MSTALPLLAVLLATTIDLPGGPPVGMDYVAYDPSTNRIWIPAGNTGTIDVFDVATGKLSVLASYPTAEPKRPGRPRMGPSSATVAGEVVWIGNRGDNRLLGFDARSLREVGSVRLTAMPDGLAYVPAKKELWATTPSDQSIKVVSIAGKTPQAAGEIKLEGSPEGYAVDEARGLFYTNLEDKDRTLAIDTNTRKVVANWPAGCGTEGPRGLAIDHQQRLLFVACTDGAHALDLAHDGKPVGQLKAGLGVDNLDYDASRHRLFIAAGKDAQLTIARVTSAGGLVSEATVTTSQGARNPVVDKRGKVYVEDSAHARLLMVDPDAVLQTRQR
jgi:DNA-binding beta-propeller fold protein YncE